MHPIIKGKIKLYKPSVVCVFDTSGSITNLQLQAFLTELDCIFNELNLSIKVIYCNSEIQKVFDYTKKLDIKVRHFCGGGGTNFCPPFHWVKENNIRPDCLIYFTDLCGPFPSPPRYNVLWVNTGEEGQRAPFGKTIYLKVYES